MQQLPRGEFSRLLTKLFGARGNVPVSVTSSITPVAIVEDATKGPFLPYRVWHAGMYIGGGAVGQYTQTHLRYVPSNPNVAGTVVVDTIILQGPAGQWFFALTPATPFGSPYGNEAFATDRDLGAGGGASSLASEPNVNDVRQGFYLGAAGYTPATNLIYASGTHQVIPGPFILRAMDALTLRSNVAQANIMVYFQGRLYDPT